MMDNQPTASLLIVDDTEANRYALTRILASAGFRIHEASTGRQALDMAMALRPQLVVLDIKLPDISGYEVCRILKADPATQHIPILQVSASFVRAEDQARGLEGGADAYLTQPVERPVLVATIHALLRARRAEEALRESERRLERQARELARSNAELEEFASILSHDLRAPLVSIGGCAQLLHEEARDKLDSEGNELLRMIQDGVALMGGMIKSLLTWSRVGAGGIQLTECDAEETLSSVIRTLWPRFEEAGAVVTHDPLPTVRADATLLTQLFQNLIENGVKYRGQEPPRIHVSAQDGEGEWTFSIRDNGIGIAPQDCERVFEMFHRGHRDEARYEGTGVGLATCKKIVERHGGRIWLESQVGEGTTFFFTLPK